MTKYMCSTLTATALLAGGVMLATVANGQQTPAATTPSGYFNHSSQDARGQGSGESEQTKAPLELKTEKEKFSYGHWDEHGREFQEAIRPRRSRHFERGMKDSLAGGKTLLTDAEAQAAIEEMKKEVTQDSAGEK